MIILFCIHGKSTLSLSELNNYDNSTYIKLAKGKINEITTLLESTGDSEKLWIYTNTIKQSVN
jgi:hypothetical protein